MEPGSIVEALDEGEDIALGLGTGLVPTMTNELGFEGVEETLHRRIGLAAGLAAHRCGQIGGCKSRAVVVWGILARRDRNVGLIRRRAAAGGAPSIARRRRATRMWSRIAQPSILRLKRSMTAARYSQPSAVGM